MVEIRPIDADTNTEIVRFQSKGAEILQLSQDAAPRDIVASINALAQQLKQDKRSLSKEEVMSLGVLLGEQYVRRFQWHWGEVVRDGNEETARICVLSQDNSIAVNPIWWFNDVVSTDRSANFLLNFNMVAEGRLPKAEVNEAVGFH